MKTILARNKQEIQQIVMSFFYDYAVAFIAGFGFTKFIHLLL